MILLSIDPSSTRTGYAVMADKMTLIEHGILTPAKTRHPPVLRVNAMIEELGDILKEYKPDKIIVESPSIAHGGIQARSGGAGAAIYGFAAGAIYQKCYEWSKETEAIEVQKWTQRVPKLKRQQLICMAFTKYDPEKDRGGDIADAIGLGLWWFSQKKAQRIAG